MVIRPAQVEDATYWERMRQSLWPSSKREHASEIARYFAGNTREPIEVLLAFSERGDAIGFVELSFRAYAEGCVSDQVAYLEGLYVAPPGEGEALVQV